MIYFNNKIKIQLKIQFHNFETENKFNMDCLQLKI